MLCLMQLRFLLLNSVIRQPYCIYIFIPYIYVGLCTYIYKYMSMRDSRSSQVTSQVSLDFKKVHIKHVNTAVTKRCKCIKQSFTLSCFPSRTLGAVANQNEELAVGKVKPSLFSSIQKELDMNKPTHLDELSRPLPLLGRIAFNTQPSGMLVINSLQVLKQICMHLKKSILSLRNLNNPLVSLLGCFSSSYKNFVLLVLLFIHLKWIRQRLLCLAQGNLNSKCVRLLIYFHSWS